MASSNRKEVLISILLTAICLGVFIWIAQMTLVVAKSVFVIGILWLFARRYHLTSSVPDLLVLVFQGVMLTVFVNWFVGFFGIFMWIAFGVGALALIYEIVRHITSVWRNRSPDTGKRGSS